jgi:hypothetical protein
VAEGEETQARHKGQGRVSVLSCEGASSLRVSQDAPTDPAVPDSRRGDAYHRGQGGALLVGTVPRLSPPWLNLGSEAEANR